MLYYFLYPLRGSFSPFNVFRYISFRAAGAAVTALIVAFVLGPWILNKLRAMQIHQVVRDGTPDSHAKKGTTPTMGGLIIIAATLIPTLLWMRLDNRYVWLAMIVMVWMGAIGFLDDYLKLKQKREGKQNRGLVERYKLAGQVICGFLLAMYIWKFPLNPLPGASTTLPFAKYVLVVPATIGMAWLYVPFVTFVMTGTSNAVNLTDGLDGLAPGLMAIAMGTLAIFAYSMGNVNAANYLQLFYLRGAGELTIFCTAVFGAAIGFLWYNSHPAEVFMGDTGSLALGGLIGYIAIVTRQELMLGLIGGIFVAEALSVMIQVGYFKYTRRRYGTGVRIFLMSPLHHHFQKKGWGETQVVVRFWIVNALLAALALATLKLR
jgi:phospho-N-acetylmuramoyl-pentapeptide-transferase